ncbi:MAG: mechanosensitive ion channel [Flavobacteriaceae bacterium]|nr:mechanosensitive ion channel [Flavobacteriaceae bacterium]
MNKRYILQIFKLLFSCFLFLNLLASSLYSQNEISPAPENSISIDKLSIETEKIGQRIYDLKSALQPIAEVSEVDSLLTIADSTIKYKRDSLLKNIEKINKRDLRVHQVQWLHHRAELKKYQEIINKRTIKISSINEELLLEIKKWTKTKENLVENSGSKEVAKSIDAVLESLQEIVKITASRMTVVFDIEKRLTSIVIVIDEFLAELSKSELNLRMDYFVFDSNPIWNQNSNPPNEDIVNNEKGSFKFKEDIGHAQSFLLQNIKTVIFQLGFIIGLMVVLILVKRKWKAELSTLSNPVEIQSVIILKHYIAASIVVGVLLSVFFYEELIPFMTEAFITILLISTFVLLPKLTNKRFSIFLGLLFAVYLISLGESYIDNSSLLIRVLLLIEIIILAIALWWGKKIIRENRNDFVRIHKLFIVVSSFYIVLLLGAFIANIIGMVGLSQFVFSGVISSTILLMVIYLSVKVTTSIFVLIFKLRRTYGLQAVSTIVNAAHKRIQPILFWVGMLLWLYITSVSFEVRDLFNEWLNASLETTWAIGEMNISLGGILSFTGIFMTAVLIAKLVSSIFEDEWMIALLPRGIAPAISLLLRIFLITFGLYGGFTAAGIDLSKLGFIVGALGVGIGFGLQNVVLNFIAGLILAFERPINIGDAIEVDSEFGVVTRVGVRSTNVRTYSGYEAIIPNGDLISKKVINWTLSNRDRRSKKFIKTSANVNPEEMIEMLTEIITKHPKTYKDPLPRVFFKGYEEDGNLMFEVWYWSTFSETITIDHEIALEIFSKLKEAGIQAPVPIRKILKD